MLAGMLVGGRVLTLANSCSIRSPCTHAHMEDSNGCTELPFPSAQGIPFCLYSIELAGLLSESSSSNYIEMCRHKSKSQIGDGILHKIKY